MPITKLQFIKRIVVGLLLSISILVFLAASTLWVSSYSRFYLVQRFLKTSRQFQIATEPGRLVLSTTYYPPETYGERYSDEWDWRSDDLPYYDQTPWKWSRLGFETNHITYGFPGSARTDNVAIPFWSICVLTVAWPVVLLCRITRGRRRFRSGHCRVCGYDLRASLERCPECGTAYKWRDYSRREPGST